MSFDKSKLLKGSAILDGINQFSKSMAGVDERIHILACSALVHAAESGDSTYLTNLVQAMPKSSRGVALKDWIIQYALCLQWTTIDGESKFKKVGGKEYDMEIIERAFEKPFYENPEAAAKPFDLARLLKIINATVKRAEKGKEKGTLKVTAESLTEIKGAVAGLVRTLTPTEVANQEKIDDVSAGDLEQEMGKVVQAA